MPTSRRSVLVGLGSIITTSFIHDARTCWKRTRQPLLLTPERPSRELFCERVDDHWQLHLGKPTFDVPEPPLSINYIKAKGYRSVAEIKVYAEEVFFPEEQFFQQLDPYG